jgi:protein arginine N-methyltransferase 1
MSYSVRDYGTMIADEVRTNAYANALRAAIRPGDVVLDLGAGTGIFSLLACRFGARRVHACDENAAVHLAAELGRANGFGDRIVCHEAPGHRLTLPEPVDVIVSELRGVLPLFGRSVSTLIDARARLLKPGGALLPQRDTLWVALASAPDEHRRAVAPWAANDLGFDLGRWSALLANGWIQAQPHASQLVSSPVLWCDLDYRAVDGPDARRRVTCRAERDAEAHGFFLWFDATISDGIAFSGGPDAPRLPYGCAFFPWPRPLAVKAADTVTIDLAAKLVGDDYTWTWRTVFGETQFEQSTFFSAVVGADTMRKRAASHAPELTKEGRATLTALEGLRGGHALGDIADELFAEFHEHFGSRDACLGFVGGLAIKYGV